MKTMNGIAFLYKKGHFLLFSTFFMMAMNHPVVANEYSLVAPEVGERSADLYFSSQKMPIVKLITKCNKKGENCWQEAVNQNGQRLRGYSQNDSVSLIASGRYKNRAAAIIRRTPEGCSDCTETKLITHRGQISDFIVPEHVGNALSVIMTAKKNLAILTPAGVEVIDRKGKTVSTLDAPAVLHYGVLRNNSAGTVAALAITDTHELVLSNLSGWVESGVILSKNGDRKGVLGIYPENKRLSHAVIYKYVNEYCKGLYYLDTDFNKKHVTNEGWLFNSEKQNIGWDPSIYTPAGQVVVGAHNSSTKEHVYFEISKNQLAHLSSEFSNSHEVCQEKLGSILVGVGMSRLSWDASSRVKWNDVNRMKVEYEISDSWSKLAQFEGRIGKTRLTLSYMENELKEFADEKGGSLAREASRWLYGLIDFEGLLSNSSMLRLAVESSKINGVAKIDEGEVRRIVAFSSEYQRIAALVMKERGYYAGLQYDTFKMPSAIGFAASTGGGSVYSYFDQELALQRLSLQGGYDTLSYTERYETDVSRWYSSGSFGVGFGWLDVSSQIERDAKSATGKTDIDWPMTWAFDGTLEFGYLWQKRARSLNGLGLVANVGVRARGVYMTAGNEDSKSEDYDSLQIVFRRSDIYYGPFMQMSVIW